MPAVLHDLTGPDHDTDPCHDPPQPPGRSYVVCSTGRSGSGLLCRALAATGVLASPLEYFNPIHREILSRRWGCEPGLEAYLHGLYARRVDAGGVFGTKLHWDQLAALCAEASRSPAGGTERSTFLERAFPDARYVRIIRRDLDRQAVSLWRALQTDVWSVAVSAPRTTGFRDWSARYDYEAIAACRSSIEHGEREWTRYLQDGDLAAHVVMYEDLVADYPATVRRTAAYLVGEELAPRVPVPLPVTRRLADRRSEAVCRRFRADRRAATAR